jgi:hypothetical protein
MTSSKTDTAYFASDTVEISMMVHEGWNLISVPVIMKNPFPHIVFPGSYGDTFEYDAMGGGYVPTDTIKAGRGYFVYFTNSGTITFWGVPVKGSIQVNCRTGWNLIGSRELPIQTNTLITNPAGLIFGDLFTYDALTSVYDTVKSLIPGYGEWVYVTGECLLTIP